jgi:hypothetical protein
VRPPKDKLIYGLLKVSISMDTITFKNVILTLHSSRGRAQPGYCSSSTEGSAPSNVTTVMYVALGVKSREVHAI